MTKYNYVGTPTMKVIEECGEVILECGALIQALSKADRFGFFNHHPDRPEINNWEEIKKEMADLTKSFAWLKETIEG